MDSNMHVYTLFNDNGKALVPKMTTKQCHKRKFKIPKNFFESIKYYLHTDNGWLKIYEYGSWNMFSVTCLAKKCIKWAICNPNGSVRGHDSIILNSVLETIQFPTCIAHLDTRLPDMHRNHLTLTWGEQIIINSTNICYTIIITNLQICIKEMIYHFNKILLE